MATVVEFRPKISGQEPVSGGKCIKASIPRRPRRLGEYTVEESVRIYERAMRMPEDHIFEGWFDEDNSDVISKYFK